MSDASTALAADRAARARALDATQSFIVQAPAGSGKTELLVQRLLTLLARVNEPAEVLAITFTKKAAGEMRERVLTALNEAKHLPMPDTSPARERWQLAARVLEQDRTRGWRLIERPTQLNIETFDAFSLRIAKVTPLSPTESNPALWSLEDDAKSMYRTAARRALLDADNLSDASHAAAVNRLLTSLDNRVDDVIEALASLLSKRSLWIERFIDDSDEAIAAFRHVLVAQIELSLSRLHRAWPAAETPLVNTLAAFAASNVTDPALRARFERVSVASYASFDIEHADDWNALAQFLITNEACTWRKLVNVKNGFPAASEKGTSAEEKQIRTQMKATFTALLERLVELPQSRELEALIAATQSLPTLQHIADHEPILRAALRLLKVAVAEFTLMERERAATDFSGVAIAARLALRDHREDIFARLDAKLSHILVDEYQDTNPAQATLIESLVEAWSPEEGRTLFIVGDPMQSIYAFRDADVSLFTEAWTRGIGTVALTPLRLAANYRSRPEIVSWVNTNIARVFADSQEAAVVDAPRVEFAEAIATRAAAEVPERGGARAMQVFSDDTAEAEAIVNDIAQVFARSPNARIAVIVRARTHADAIVHALQASRMNFVAREMSAWSERAWIRDLISLTYLIAQPEDRLSWFAWLRSPMVGLTLRSLSTIVEFDASSSQHWPRALRDQNLLTQLGVEDRERLQLANAALDAISAHHDGMPLAMRVHRVYLQCGGFALAQSADEREEIDSFFALLDDATSDALLPPRSVFEAAIAEKKQSFSSAEIQSATPPPVEVLTIHRAKGLEWDYVYLPQLSKTPPAETRSLVTWSLVRTPQRGYDAARSKRDEIASTMAQLLVAAKETRRKRERSVFDFVHARGVALRAAEMKRLLYVAVTRAREDLWLSGVETRAKSPVPTSLASLLEWPTTSSPSETVEVGEITEASAASSSISSDKRRIMSRSLTRAPREFVASQTAKIVSNVGHPHHWETAELNERMQIAESVAPAVVQDAQSSDHAATDALGASATHDARLERRNEIARGVVGHKLIEGLARARRRGEPFTVNERAISNALVNANASVDAIARETVELVNALKLMTHSAHFAFIHDSQNHAASDELPVAILNRADAALKRLRVDRTFVSAVGERWIVDYKFSRPPGTAQQEHWLATQMEVHRAQLVQYTTVFRELEPSRRIRAALYFPLLDAWAEIAST